MKGIPLYFTADYYTRRKPCKQVSLTMLSTSCATAKHSRWLWAQQHCPRHTQLPIKEKDSSQQDGYKAGVTADCGLRSLHTDQVVTCYKSGAEINEDKILYGTRVHVCAQMCVGTKGCMLSLKHDFKVNIFYTLTTGHELQNQRKKDCCQHFGHGLM